VGVAAGKGRGHGVRLGKVVRCGAMQETAMQGGHAGGHYGDRVCTKTCMKTPVFISF
jgi:hypothetical protein